MEQVSLNDYLSGGAEAFPLFCILKETGDERQRLEKKEDGDGIGGGVDDGSMHRHSGFGEKQNAEKAVFEGNDDGGGYRGKGKGVREEDKAV